MIVVFSHPDDRHAEVILADLARHGVDAFLLDLADLPERLTLTIDHARAERPTVMVEHLEHGTVELTAATAAWWRRPLAPTLTAISDPDALGFAHGEWHEALNGTYQLLACPWMNHPVRNEVASRKALQLVVASRLGFRTPRTLMTSDPDRARTFIEREGLGNVVHKTFAATHQVWRETRLVDAADLDVLDSLRYAPVIFQEYVPATADLRVTIVGDEIFPMGIDARGTDYEVDFRVSMQQAATSVMELPSAVERGLRTLMTRLGLAYGAVDLRRTEDGDHVFLEINPAGEFLFVEHCTGLPVTDAVSRWLRRESCPTTRPPN